MPRFARSGAALSRHLVFILLLGGLLSLGGCATAPEIVETRAPSDQMLRADEGIVVLSMTSNTPQVGQFDTVMVERVPDAPETGKPAQQFKVRQVSRGMARDTALFIGVLKAGDYTLSAFQEEKTFKTLWLNGGSKLLGSFKVEAGKTTDLGRLLMTPVNFQTVTTRSSMSTSNRKLVERFSPDNLSAYAGTVIEGWSIPAKERSPIEAFALTHPVGTTALTELEDGRLAAATRLGTVMLRGKDGRWALRRSGNLESLLWLTPYDKDGASLLAVGEFNTLLKLDGNSKLVEMGTGDLPPGNILFIAGKPAVGWFIAHQQGEAISIYRTETLEQPRWERLATESVTFDFWRGLQKFWIWPTSDGFGYAVSKGDINFYNFSSKSWSRRHAPNGSSLNGVAVSPNDVLGILTSPGGGLGGIFSSTYYTRDQGQSWIETKSPYKVKVSPPLITTSGTLLEIGGVFGQTGIQASADDGKTWKPLSTKDDDSVLQSQLWATVHNGLFRIDNARLGVEMLEHSSDDGATWRLEYSSFDREIYDIQQEKAKK